MPLVMGRLGGRSEYTRQPASPRRLREVAVERLRFYTLRTKGFNVGSARLLASGGPDVRLGGGALGEREFLFLQPVNGVYDAWFADRVSATKLISSDPTIFQKHNFHVLLRDGELLIIPLSAEAKLFRPSLGGIAEFLKECGPVELLSADWSLPESDPVTIQAVAGGIEVDGVPCPESRLRALLMRHVTTSGASVLVSPWKEESVRRYLFANVDGAEAELVPLDADRLPGESAGAAHQLLPFEERLFEACRRTPQLELGEFRVAVQGDRFRVIGLTGAPEPASVQRLSAETIRALQSRAAQKACRNDRSRNLKRWVKYGRRRLRKDFAAAAYPTGLVPYQATRWPRDVLADLGADTGVSAGRKLWAYRNGSLSCRLPQYGITEENRSRFISDFEYRWLRHINGPYRSWVEQKLTTKNVVPQHARFFPDNYYLTSASTGLSLRPMSDLPDGYGTSHADFLRLVRERGTVAMKPASGSHGEGFRKLEYRRGEYLVNGEPWSPEQILALLADPENRYLVTEYIQQHDELAKYHPQSVNTVRVTVFKRDGINPAIGNAYLRLGSTSSGYVDNVVAGAMIAEVDLESGRYHSGTMLKGGRTVSSPVHPGSGLAVEGVLPHWARIKSVLLDIARELPQLDYLGFDVAITQDGFKIPEINRFPDFPRVSKLTPETIDYLLYKVEMKKGQTGCSRRTLFRLPSRNAGPARDRGSRCPRSDHEELAAGPQGGARRSGVRPHSGLRSEERANAR